MINTEDVNWLKRHGKVLLCVIAIPLMFVWMLIDHRLLKQIALEIEPMDAPPEYATVVGRWVGWFLRNVVGKVLAFFILPCVVIYGMILMLFSNQSDDTSFF